MQDYITSALATLLIVADPIFLSAIFLGLTNGLSVKDRREVALRGSLIAFCILVGRSGIGWCAAFNFAGDFTLGVSHCGWIIAVIGCGRNGI
jgi:multiple antibiotic resistance protein